MGFRDRFKKVFASGKKENNDNDYVDEIKRDDERPKIDMSSDDVLFVCSSNTVISPMAEAIFNGKKTDKKAFSAGITAGEGNMPSANAIEVCLNHGIDLTSHGSTNIDNFKLNPSGMILTSSVSVRDFLKDIYPGYQIFTINEYAGFSNLDIGDPFGSDLDAFEECFCEIENAIDEILGTDNNASEEEYTAPSEEIEEVPIKASSYISSLIDSGNKLIKLDCNINGSFNIDVDDVVIEGEGHTIDLARNRCIITGNNITLKDLTFKNGFGEGYEGQGGAILNKGSLTLINCNFTGNHAKEVQAGAIANFDALTCIGCEFHNNTSQGDCYTKGGAIWNTSFLTLRNCIFKNNMAEKSGGAIFNYDGYLKVENCSFENNSVKKNGFFVVGKGGAILNQGKMDCFKSTFSENESSYGSSIYNCEEVSLSDSTFTNSTSSSTIHQTSDDAVINISQSRVDGQTYIEKGMCIVKKSDFASLDTYNLYNEGGIVKIPSTEDKPSTFNSIYNNSIIKISAGSGVEGLIECGENSHIEYLVDKLDSDWRGFDHLNDLILNEESRLNLDCDIIMHEGEQFFYEGGIEISKDNFTINGNGHVIDASNLSRIFYITSNNVTLKNIIFKNGQYFKNFFDEDSNGGGAIFICHGCEVTIENCEFRDNISKKSAGAINSRGDSLKLINSSFENNLSENDGGCIHSISDMDIECCIFENNCSSRYHGGVICGYGVLTVSDCDFLDNYGYNGGVIYNEGSLSLMRSNFKGNEADQGGVIFADEIHEITNCTFKNNSAGYGGGVIYAESISSLKDSTFESNEASADGSAIYASLKLNIENSLFKSNSTRGYRGVICAYGVLNICGCHFEDNSSRYDGAAITTICDEGESNITDSSFTNNRCDSGSAIYSHNHLLNVGNCSFAQNSNSGVFNDGLMNLRDCHFDNGEFIQNYGTLDILYSQKESLIGGIENNGDVKITYDEEVIAGSDFDNLYYLISNLKSKTFELESDFKFKPLSFDIAIPLDGDNLVIDGKGHVINSLFNNVFKVMGKGIVLKNITFKNSKPLLQDNNASITIEDCSFEDCTLSGFNRAVFKRCNFASSNIKNKGVSMNFKDCVFFDCDLRNMKAMDLTGCRFEGFESDVLYNEGTCFIKNLDLEEGHRITNRAELFILDSEKHLSSKIDGNVKIMPNIEKHNNFSYLNYLAQNFTEISLNEDIVFDLRYDSFNHVLLNHDGLIIDGNGHSIDARGIGGIFKVIASNVILKNISFLNASDSAVVNQSEVKVIDCDFKNNISKFDGGAIHNVGNLTLINCYFENNSSTNEMTDGGAIKNVGSAFITRCVFNSNHSVYSGGAIYTSGEMHLDNCVFNENKSKLGGAIRSYGGRTQLLECLFENNSSSEGGGVYVYGSDGEFILTSSRFISNSSMKGGGIYMDTGHDMSKISECFFKDNSAVHGGVLFNEDKSSLGIVDSIFESNRADNEGGVIYGGRLDVDGSKFHDNFSGGYGNVLYNTCDSKFSSCEFFTDNADSCIIFNNALLILNACEFKSPGSDIIINSKDLKVENTAFEKHHKILK